jgi:hypothetical protein
MFSWNDNVKLVLKPSVICGLDSGNLECGTSCGHLCPTYKQKDENIRKDILTFLSKAMKQSARRTQVPSLYERSVQRGCLHVTEKLTG